MDNIDFNENDQFEINKIYKIEHLYRNFYLRKHGDVYLLYSNHKEVERFSLSTVFYYDPGFGVHGLIQTDGMVKTKEKYNSAFCDDIIILENFMYFKMIFRLY